MSIPPRARTIQTTISVVLAALTSFACGGASEAPATAHSAGEELDWAHGAPQVEGSFTEDEQHRLSVCALLSTTMFAAGDSRKRGVTQQAFEADLAKKGGNEAVVELVTRFVEATYRDDFEDPVEFTYSHHGTCIEKVVEISGDLAQRAEFCLGRNLVAVVGYRWRANHSQQDLAERLRSVPGFAKPYLAVGHAGTFPETSYLQECLLGS